MCLKTECRYRNATKNINKQREECRMLEDVLSRSLLWRKREGNENDQRNNHLDANVSLHVDTNYNQITDMHKFFWVCRNIIFLFFFLKQTSAVTLSCCYIYMKWSCSERMWCNMIKKQLQKSTRLILQSKTGRWAVETIEIRNKETSECSFSVWLAAELWEVKCHISAERLRMGKCLNVQVKH